jgi:murein L,D-transpeptidase YcbB/YkuD
MFLPLILLILFAGLKRGGGGDGASSSRLPSNPAANAQSGIARPASTTAAELAARQAGVDAAVTAAIREEQARAQKTNAAVVAAKTEAHAAVVAAKDAVDALRAKVEESKPKLPDNEGVTIARTPKQVAQALAAFLTATHRFGSKNDQVPEVKAAQGELGLKADGIVGPATRAACAKLGVKLPLRDAEPTKKTTTKTTKGKKR